MSTTKRTSPNSSLPLPRFLSPAGFSDPPPQGSLSIAPHGQTLGGLSRARSFSDCDVNQQTVLQRYMLRRRVAAFVLGVVLASASRGQLQLINPGFDTDLAGWVIDGDNSTHGAEWSPIDADGSATSGSARVFSSTPFISGRLHQCMNIGTARMLEAEADLLRSIATGAVSLSMVMFLSPDCQSQMVGTGLPVDLTLNPEPFFQPVRVSQIPPTRARSASLRLEATAFAPDDPVELSADNLLLTGTVPLRNLLPNPGFDSTLEEWTFTTEGGSGSGLQLDPLDAAGDTSSFSARLTHADMGDSESLLTSSCIDIPPDALPFLFMGALLSREAQTPGLEVSLRLALFDGADCGGQSRTFEVPASLLGLPPSQISMGDSWLYLGIGLNRESSEISATLEIRLTNPLDPVEPNWIRLDDVMLVVGLAPLFSDGFEAGTLSNWSRSSSP
jgi:hypothetical protein